MSAFLKRGQATRQIDRLAHHHISFIRLTKSQRVREPAFHSYQMPKHITLSESSAFYRRAECPKGWANRYFATEITESIEKKLKISEDSVPKPTTLDTPSIYFLNDPLRAVARDIFFTEAAIEATCTRSGLRWSKWRLVQKSFLSVMDRQP